jgi:outer membrane protein assembly factor BamA
VRQVVVIALSLLVAGAAFAQEGAGDDPKSSVTEWPPRPKPAPPPPKPAPPANAQAKPSQGAGKAGGGAGTPADSTTKPGDAGAKTGEEPVKTGETAAGSGPALAPEGEKAKALGEKPPKPNPPPQSNALVPDADGPRPDVGSGGIRTIDGPAGKSFDQVTLPRGVLTSDQKNIGDVITDIKVIDNSRTDAETVRYIAGVKIGMFLTLDLVEQARLRLLTVGLFKDVNIAWEEAFPGHNAGVRLIISAKDKLSWIVAPLFSYSQGNYGGGLAYANSNVFGKNEKFLVLGQYTTAQKLLFVAFLDPQIHNTRFYYRVDGLVRRDSIWEYAAGNIANPRIERATDVDTFGAAALVGVNITRRFHFDLRLKIYYDNVQPSTCYNTTNSDGSGTPDVVAEQGKCYQPSSSGWDNTLTGNFAYDGRSNVYGVLHGLLVQATYQYGASWLGTKSDYHLVWLYGMYAWRFFKEHNLLLKLGADIDFDAPFKLEVETGGPLMRGLLLRQYRGDTDVRGTLEYILPLFTLYGLSVRAIGFYDTNLTWFRSLPDQTTQTSRYVVRGHSFRDFLPDTPSGVVRESWHNGVGGGIRLYLRGVILPLLGVDFAYGIEGNEFQWYLSIGSTLD